MPMKRPSSISPPKWLFWLASAWVCVCLIAGLAIFLWAIGELM